MLTELQPGIDVRLASERFATRIDWLDSKHSFSFGRHYDPRNTNFGLLLVSNDDIVAPGTGFETQCRRVRERRSGTPSSASRRASVRREASRG